MKQDTTQILGNYRHLVNKLVYIKQSSNYMEVRKKILNELLRFKFDFMNGTVNTSSYKESFKLVRSYPENTFDICTNEMWRISINKDSIEDLVLFLKSEGLNVDEYKTTCEGGEESLARRGR